jgi:hypothetical protein
MRQFGKALVLCALALLLMAKSSRAQSFSIKAGNTTDGDLRVSFTESGLKSEIGQAVGYTITGSAACAAGSGPVGTAFSLTVDSKGQTSAVVGVEEPLGCEGVAGKSLVYSGMQLCDTTNSLCQAF